MTIAIPIVSLLFTGSVEAQDWKSRLRAAPAIKDIVKFYEKFSEFGTPHKQEMSIDGRKYFAYWIDGATGRGELFWLYQLKNKDWNLVIDHPQGAAHFRSRVVWNMVDHQFQIISQKGEILASYPDKGELAAPPVGGKPPK